MADLGKQLLYLTESDVQRCINEEEAIALAEKGIILDGQGKVAGNKFYMDINADGFLKPFSGYIQGEDLAFVKIFSLFPGNNRAALYPDTTSIVILYDSQTGIPVCFMEASWITGLKTGASTAVTAKYLARPGSQVATIFGAGMQGRHHLACLSKIFSLSEVRIYDKYPEKSQTFSEEMSRKLGLKVVPIFSREEAVEGSDIVITVTTGKDILVRRQWLKQGAFVARMGTYQEIDTELILEADKFIVDRWEYVAPRVPEVAELIAAGRLDRNKVYAEWPEIASGIKYGRTGQEIIVFTALGIWGEYAAILPQVYRSALKQECGTLLKFSQSFQ